MLGTARLANSGERVNLQTGVQVDMVGKPVANPDGGLLLELRAGSAFTLAGEIETAAEGWTEGRVEFLALDDDDSTALDRPSLARATDKATQLPALSVEWIALARTRERAEGQIDTLLQDLGEIPTTGWTTTPF
jgi:hypothetical protein